MATRGLTKSNVNIVAMDMMIAQKPVDLRNGDVLRGYGVLAYNGTLWFNRVDRHGNPSIFTTELDMTGGQQINLLAPALSVSYETAVT